ncbi:MAG: 50S ribosomal protein L29 [Patescibacteria group bacterium]
MKSKEFKKTIKDATVDDLKNKLSELNQKLVETKFAVSLNQIKNNSEVSKTRKQIAVLKTELNNRKITSKSN